MKRILIAAIIAVGIHGFLLCMEFDWVSGKSSGRSKPKIMTMKLVARQPVKPKPTVNKPTATNRIKKKIAEEKNIVKKQKKKNIEKLPESKRLNNENKKEKSESVDLNIKADKIRPELKEKPDDFTAEQSAGISGIQELKTIREAIPVYDKNPTPEYPLIARRRGLQGTVVLEVLVNKNGRVGDLRVFNSSGYKVLDRAAVKSVGEWIFRPAIKGNKNIEMWVRVPVCFQLTTNP